jgi:hypothetical protein
MIASPLVRAIALAAVAAALSRSSLTARQTSPISVPAAPSMTAILLLDVSASVSRVPMMLEPRHVQVFNAFLAGLRAGDLAGVGVIARGFELSAVTADRRELSSAARTLLRVNDVERLGPSPIWDALDGAVAALAAASGRRAILLFSDGKSSGNVRGLQEVISHARESDVSISAVVEGESSPGGTPAGLDPADLIATIVKATGGRIALDRPANPRDRNPVPMIAQMLDDLHR